MYGIIPIVCQVLRNTRYCGWSHREKNEKKAFPEQVKKSGEKTLQNSLALNE